MDPLLAGGLAVAAALLSMGGTYLVVRRFAPAPGAPRDPTRDAVLDAEAARRAEARGNELIEQSRRDAEQSSATPS